ncbi:MAG: hypothetical protein V5783_07890 [Pontiella sp.]
MKTAKTILALFTVTASLMLTGCATTANEYDDEQEYSNMPWNTPQQWEGSSSIPGLSSGQNY